MAVLSAEERATLRDGDFAVPAKRLLPIHDAAHARLAWDELDRTGGLDASEREEARQRIMRALHRQGVRFRVSGLGERATEGPERAARAPTPDAREAPVVEASEALVEDVAEAAVADEAGHVVEVTIVRPGVSNNGYIYTAPVLRAAVPLWEGAPAFLDHPTALDLTRAGARSLRDLVGVYEGARYEEGRGIRAKLRLLPSAEGAGVFETVRESVKLRGAGRATPPIGISADWRLLKSPAKPGADGRARWNVHTIVAVNSGDVVIRPSAGGSFDRILEGIGGPVAGVGEECGRLDVVGDAAGIETMGPVGGSGSGTAQASGAPLHAMSNAPLAAANSGPLAAVNQGMIAGAIDAALAPYRQQLAATLLDARLGASGLPEPARALVRSQFQGRVFEAAELDAAIGGLKGMLGEVFGQASIRGAGSVLDPGRAQGTTPLEKVQAAFDRLFGLEVAAHLAEVPRLTGIREAYVLVTGDKFFTGNYHWEDSIVREANETTSSTMSNVVLNSMTKRLVKDYQAQPKWWEPIAIKTPVLDMKQQHRIRLADFGSLSTVTEDAAYTNVAWGDARENYTPSKFGNLVVVTLEMFLNDDLHAVVRIPTKLAHAAIVTINEQIANLFTQSSGTGPTMADGFHVFDATNHQGNTSSSTPTYDLSSSSLQSAMTALEKIQNVAGKRIGVRGRYLLIPPDLRWTAAVITQSQYAAGTANNDINPLAGAVIPIVVPQFTTPYQWYLMADPMQIESLELGFLNGREEPELLVQDNPTQGAVFTNDAISYKIRHIYGCGWLDYRGAFAALPSS